jgi:hypothetical protein
MADLVPLVAVLAVAIVVVLWITWSISRSKAILDRWAQQNGYDIVQREHRLFRRGPFWWRTHDGQTVYYVVVHDRQGHTRRAWVRCGSMWAGLLSDQATVIWDG